jgi:predicted site-specific integrase-resolvase
VDTPERDENDRLIPPAEAARLRGVSTRSLRYWNSLGLIDAEKTPGGHRRYWLSEVRSLTARPAELIAAAA